RLHHRPREPGGVHAGRGQPRRPGGRLRRPRGPRGLPHGRPDPRLDRHRRAPAPQLVLPRHQRRDRPRVPPAAQRRPGADPGRRLGRARLSDRARGEQRLGWMLVAPAVAVMLLVTAYPLGRAVWLSLYSYRLTDPEGREFVGLRNYGVVLTDGLWWQTVFT